MKAIILAILIVLLLPPLATTGQEAQRPQELESLWFDISLGEPLVHWFNQAARPTDIARANDISELELLDSIEVGQKLIIFKSIRIAEEHLPRMADRVDIIGYNLEANPATPADEQADPLSSIIQMRALADQYGLALALGPDHDFAMEYGTDLAPYVDIFVLQIQRVQTNPKTVHEFVIPLTEQLRQTNPAVQISVQVRTEGDVPALVELLASLQQQETIDGVSILTSPSTLGVFEELVTNLRPSSPHVDLAEIAAQEIQEDAPPQPDRQPVSWWLSSGTFGVGVLAGAGSVLLLFVLMVTSVVVVAIALTLLAAIYHLLTRQRDAQGETRQENR